MEKDYYSMNREELIEKLKSKDEQITDMSNKFDCMKAEMQKEVENSKMIRFEAYQELKNKNEVNEATIKELKETIVLMSIRAFGSQESMFDLFKNIDKNLNILNKTLCGNNKQDSTREVKENGYNRPRI